MEPRYSIGDIITENDNYYLIEGIEEGNYLWRFIGCTHDRASFINETGRAEFVFIYETNGVTKVA